MDVNEQCQDRWAQNSIRLGYRRCTSCEREHPAGHLVDDECPQCRGEEPEPRTPQERARQRLFLFRSTAKVLREIGRGDSAVWYEEQIPELERQAGEVAS